MRPKNFFTRWLAQLLSAALVFTSFPVSQVAHAAPSASSAAALSLPESLGTVTDFHQGPRQVLLIQDLHLHYPTQQRILKILNLLQSKGLVQGRIAIEGLNGDYDTTTLASYPPGKTKEKVVDYFMQKGELSGDEAFAILRGEGHRLYGVEEANYYQLNRELYKSTLGNRKALQSHLSVVQNKLAVLKKENYSFALRRLDQQTPYDTASAERLLSLKLRAADTVLVRNLVEIDHSLYFLDKLLRQETTLEEVQYLARRLPQFVRLTDRLLDLDKASGALSAMEIEEVLKSSVDFYAVALMRDKPLAANTVKLLQNQFTVVLIVGGFHTAGVTQELKKAGIGYTVITPRIDEVDAAYHSLYEARVAGQHVTISEVAHDLHGRIPAAEKSMRVITPLKELLPAWKYAWGLKSHGIAPAFLPKAGRIIRSKPFIISAAIAVAAGSWLLGVRLPAYLSGFVVLNAITGGVPEGHNVEARISDHFRDMPDSVITSRKLAKDLGINEDLVRPALYHLVENGFLTQSEHMHYYRADMVVPGVEVVQGDRDSLLRVLDNPEKAFVIKLGKPYLDAFGPNLNWYIDRLVKSTAGVRGVIEIDPKDILGGAQLNAAVIFFVAQAYADYIKENYPKMMDGREIQRAAFDGFDERHFSADFADIFARVFAANEIQVNRDSDHPASRKPVSTATPVSSYAAYHLRLASAIEITASHNPPNQTGVKSQSSTGGVDLDSIGDIIAEKAKALYQRALYGEGEVRVNGLNDAHIQFVNAKQIYYENYWKRIFTRERMVQMEANFRKTQGKVLLDGLFGVAGPTFRYYLNRMIEDYGLDRALWMERILIRNDQADPNMGGLKKPDPSDPNTLALAGDLDVLIKDPSIRVVSVSDMDADRIGTATIIPHKDVEKARRLGLFVSELQDMSGNKVYAVRFTPNQIFTLQAYGRALEAIRTNMGYATLEQARDALVAANGGSSGHVFKEGELERLQDIRKRLVIITTVPTSMITKALMDFLGGRIINCCVGFKYLGDQAYELDKAYREAKENRSIILSILEESGGAQIGPVDFVDQFDADDQMSIHRDKDTLTETMELFFHAVRLDAKKENLLDFYSEMAQNLGGLLYYERLDAYLPTQAQAESMDANTIAEATRIKEAMADRAAVLEKADQGLLLLNLFRAVLGQETTLKQSRKVVVDDAVFLLKDEHGQWMNVSPKGIEHTYSNGWRIQTFHIGSEGKEGPAIRIFNPAGKEIVRTAFRKSGTESLVRLYMEIFEPTEGGNPHHLIAFFAPLIQYLGLDKYSLKVDGTNYLEGHVTSIRNKYPSAITEENGSATVQIMSFLAVGLGSLTLAAALVSSWNVWPMALVIMGVSLAAVTLALAGKIRKSIVAFQARRQAQQKLVRDAHQNFEPALKKTDAVADMSRTETTPQPPSNRLLGLFTRLIPRNQSPAAGQALSEATQRIWASA